MLAETELAKIQLTGPEGDVETLWARSVGENLYELHNTPWYAYGISWHDVIEARPLANGLPEFVRVVRKSGYRTIRLMLDPPADRAAGTQAILDKLRALGCSYEGFNPAYLAIDIPPSVDLMALRDFLISTGQTWEHADPTYEQLFPNDGPAA